MTAQTPKGAGTRQLLLDASLRLFEKQGFEKTTMRAIAAESGLSVGNAYYYFESKDALVGELYRILREKQRLAAWPVLQEGNNLETNLRTVLDAALDALEPYRDFGPAFLRAATGGPAGRLPGQPPELALWRQAVAMASPPPPMGIRRDLPELLALVERGIVLHWAYDSSPGHARTRRLVRNTAPFIARLSVLSRLPVVRTVLDEALAIVRSTADPAPAPSK